MNLRVFALALGVMVMAVLAGCGEVATPTTIPTAVPTVPGDRYDRPGEHGNRARRRDGGRHRDERGDRPEYRDGGNDPGRAGRGSHDDATRGRRDCGGHAIQHPHRSRDGRHSRARHPAAAGTPSLSDPRQVVQDFLTSLQSQPDGSASVPYLSDYQQLRIAAGKSVASLLGIQDMYQSFTVGDAQTSGNRAVVRATLNFASGSQVRDFTLNSDSAAWTINSITPVQSSK